MNERLQDVKDPVLVDIQKDNLEQQNSMIKFRRSLFFASILITACVPQSQGFPTVSLQKVNESKNEYMRKNISVYGYLNSKDGGGLYTLHSNKEAFLIKSSIDTLFIETEKDLEKCHGFFVFPSGQVQAIKNFSNKNLIVKHFSIYEGVTNVETGLLPTEKQILACTT